MIFTIFIFLVAAAISSVAAYFSLVGLGSIFAATFWGVVIMGGVLEIGKVVTTKWVHGNWRNPAAPWYFRALLCFFIACLMTITSLGIYGYLSRGHLEQQAPLGGLAIQVAQLETQVQQKKDDNTRLEQRLQQINHITDKVLDGNGRAGLQASQRQKSETREIQKSIDANNQSINDLTTKLVPLKMKTGDVQGELGVAKFIAEAFGWAPEKAVRIIISLIMATFDTLALSMFIMGSISLKDLRERKNTKTVDHDFRGVEPKNPQEIEVEHQVQVANNEAAEHDVPPPSDDVTPAEDDTLKEEINQQRRALDEELEIFDQRLNALQEDRAQHGEDVTRLNQREEMLNEVALSLERTGARLQEESDLMKQWEAQLSLQQQSINTWSPPEDPRPIKERIFAMLEENPEIINDIVDAIRPPQKPGL